MTHEEIWERFKNEFPLAKADDYRPICHELFTDGKLGITIWLENGDVIEYYPYSFCDDMERRRNEKGNSDSTT